MPHDELLTPMYRSWPARWSPTCPVCPIARKDHTFPMLDVCDRVAAERRGFRPWMIATLGAIGERLPS